MHDWERHNFIISKRHAGLRVKHTHTIDCFIVNKLKQLTCFSGSLHQTMVFWHSRRCRNIKRIHPSFHASAIRVRYTYGGQHLLLLEYLCDAQMRHIYEVWFPYQQRIAPCNKPNRMFLGCSDGKL